MILRCFILFALLWLCSCNEEANTTREEQRIRREVEQRVESIRVEMKVSESRWHTVRIVSFCLLAGGSLIWLCRVGSFAQEDSPRIRDGENPESGNRRRVIDRPYGDDHEPDEYSYRR